MKKRMFKITKFIVATVLGISCLYLLIYFISFFIYNPDKQKGLIQEEMKQDILFQPDLDHIVSVEWKNPDVLYLVKQEYFSDPNISEHSKSILLEYDVRSREILSEKDISSFKNMILGKFDNKPVLCVWNFSVREAKDQIATKIEILDLDKMETIDHIDLYSTAKIDSCKDNLVKVSEGLPVLAPFMEVYDVSIREKVEKFVPEYEIKGNITTDVYYNGEKIFTLDLPNKYTSISTLYEIPNYALVDVDGKVLVYIKQ